MAAFATRSKKFKNVPSSTNTTIARFLRRFTFIRSCFHPNSICFLITTPNLSAICLWLAGPPRESRCAASHFVLVSHPPLQLAVLLAVLRPPIEDGLNDHCVPVHRTIAILAAANHPLAVLELRCWWADGWSWVSGVLLGNEYFSSGGGNHEHFPNES